MTPLGLHGWEGAMQRTRRGFSPGYRWRLGWKEQIRLGGSRGNLVVSVSTAGGREKRSVPAGLAKPGLGPEDERGEGVRNGQMLLRVASSVWGVDSLGDSMSQGKLGVT